MYVKINKWVLSILAVGTLAFAVFPGLDESYVFADELVISEGQGEQSELTAGAVEQEKLSVNAENKPQEKKKETAEYEQRLWPSDAKGLRIKQDSTVTTADFLSLAPLTQLEIDKIEWGGAAPVTNKSGDFTTALLLTMKDGKQVLYQEVPYLVYSSKEETLISGLSYDKQARKLTGKTDAKVQVTAEAQFSKNPSDLEITATESDENGVFAFVYEKEPWIISVTVAKDPHIQYATTKYEIETNQVQMHYSEQEAVTSEEANQTANTAEPTPVSSKKRAENLPQTGEKPVRSFLVMGELCLCVALGTVWVRMKQEKIES